MKTRVDARLLDEAGRLRFRFACEDCAHFAPEDETCSFGYHAAPRRAELEALAGPTGPLAGSSSSSSARLLELCKAFELA